MEDGQSRRPCGDRDRRRAWHGLRARQAACRGRGGGDPQRRGMRSRRLGQRPVDRRSGRGGDPIDRRHRRRQQCRREHDRRRSRGGRPRRRRVRCAARAGQQRRHPARPDVREHDRRRLGRGDARSPAGDVRPHPRRRPVLARSVEGRRSGTRLDRQHVVDVRAHRCGRPVQLRRGEGRHRGDDRDPRPGARPLRRHASTRSRRLPGRA